MGRTLTITLTDSQRSELEHGFKNGHCHLFRQRCHSILLKADGLVTKDILYTVKLKSQNQINFWVKRYKELHPSLGISVLHNAQGQGRKPIFEAGSDTQIVKDVVKEERQKLINAKVILEQELNKSFHIKTLRNFLKVLAADIKD